MTKLNMPGTDLKISVTKPEFQDDPSVQTTVQDATVKSTDTVEATEDTNTYEKPEILREVSPHERIPCNWTITSLVNGIVSAYSDSGNTFKGKKEDYQALFK